MVILRERQETAEQVQFGLGFGGRSRSCDAGLTSLFALAYSSKCCVHNWLNNAEDNRA